MLLRSPSYLDEIFSDDDFVWCLSESLDDGSLDDLMRLSLKDRFLKQYDAWQRGRSNINQRFQRALTERQAELHAALEQESEGIKVELRKAVVGEVLKAFP
jgi:hypothetical protein